MTPEALRALLEMLGEEVQFVLLEALEGHWALLTGRWPSGRTWCMVAPVEVRAAIMAGLQVLSRSSQTAKKRQRYRK